MTHQNLSKRVIYVERKGFIEVLKDKLRMVILSFLIELFLAQSQGHEQKPLTLFLLFSVCFGWTKSPEIQTTLPQLKTLERWFRTQKFTFSTHSHPLCASVHKLTHVSNSPTSSRSVLPPIPPRPSYGHANALKQHMRTDSLGALLLILQTKL